jgi:hypothetical protein
METLRRTLAVALIAATLAVTAACGASYQDLGPVLVNGLDKLEEVADHAHSVAVNRSDVGGCIGTLATKIVFGAAHDVVAADGRLFPALSIDYGSCVLLDGGKPVAQMRAVDAQAAIKGIEAATHPVGLFVDWMLALGDVACTDAALAKALTTYVLGIAPALLEELAEPDGAFTVAAAEVDVGPCAD